MKKLILTLLPFITVIGCEQVEEYETELTDKCPRLTEEIESQRPQYDDFVTVETTHPDWDKQYKKRVKAEQAFEDKYSEEIQAVEKAWIKIEARYSPEESKFNYVTAKTQDDLLDEIRVACWESVMGNNEFGKYNYCYEIDDKPSPQDFKDMYSCIIKRSEALGIELYD